MGRLILVVDRSPLARNVYLMLLSKLGVFDVGIYESPESMDSFEEKARGSALVIASQSTFDERKGEVIDVLKMLAGENGIPSILLVHNKAAPSWKGLAEFKNIKILERPFLPDDFLGAVGKLWGG